MKLSATALLFSTLALCACASSFLGTKRFSSVLEGFDSTNRESFRLQLDDLCRDKIEIACHWLGRGQQTAQTLKGLSILQGVTADSSTQISIVTDKNETLFYVIYPNHLSSSTPYQQIRRLKAERKMREFSSFAVDKLSITGLESAMSYVLEVVRSDGRLLDRRHFQTLNTTKPNLEFIVASCMDEYYLKEQAIMWPAVWSKEPDFILLIGDNVYIDRQGTTAVPQITEEMIWNRYVSSRQKLLLYNQSKLIPIFATWDDHDYGIDDGNKDFPLKNESLEVFNTFYAQDRVEGFYERGPGVSSFFQVAGQNFALMDDRFFRTDKQSPQAEQSHWGYEQQNWLIENLNKNKSPTWLINGDQFFGSYHTLESFAGNHPDNFKQLLQQLRMTPETLLFISGDRHLSEIMKIPSHYLGYDTYEFTSSGIHAKVFDDGLMRFANPYRIAGRAGTYNFMSFKTKTLRKYINIQVAAFGPNDEVLYQKQFQVRRK